MTRPFRPLFAAFFLAFVFSSFGCEKRSEPEPEKSPAPPSAVVETEPAKSADSAPPPAPAATDADFAAFGREYVAKFNANPARTYADLIDIAKIVDFVAKNEVVPVDSETLAEIESDLLASGKTEIAKRSAPLFAESDFYFVGVRRLDAKTFVVLRVESLANGVNYFMIESAPNANGRLAPGDVFVPLQGVCVAETIAAGIVEVLARAPRGFEKLNPRKVKEYARLREYIQKSDAATQAFDFEKIVALYEEYDVANSAFTSRDAAYIGALAQLLGQTDDPADAAELERKILDTSRRIATRTPGYLGGEIALLDVYATRADEAKFDAAVEKIRALVGNDPYWEFVKTLSFPEDAPEKTLESLRKIRETGLESRIFSLYFLQFLSENFPENAAEIAEIAALYEERFGESPFAEE